MYLQEKLFLVAVTLLGLGGSPIIVTKSAATLMPSSTTANILTNIDIHPAVNGRGFQSTQTDLTE